MPVDIRATVSCSLGTVISGNVSDDYVQGTGLIKCSGTVVISGIITPAIGTAVTFSYVKSGVTRTIPRKLRVLSSFADPFRRTTSVELGCKLTYLSDKKDSIDWTAFDDTENTLTEADAEIITIPIRAQAVAKKCMDELGVSGTFTLTNKFSIAEFDLSSGYVQVLSDLLVSESLCGYLDANEVLQVFSLDQPGGTGPVLDMAQLVDISKIGSGQLPGEAVTVSYSSLRLKQDINQGEEGGESPWDKEINQSRYYVDIPYGAPADGAFGTRRYNILEKTITTTTYRQLVTQAGETRRVVGSRWTDFTTSSPAVAGGLISEYLANGIGYFSRQILKQTFEDYEYDADGLEQRYTRLVRGSFLFLAGSAGVPFVFGDSHVSINDSLTVNLEKEERITVTSGDRQLVQTTVWAPWFKSIAGQQSISRAFPSFTSTSDVIGYLNTIASDSLAIIDKRSEIRQTSQPESAPSGADINNATNAKGGSAGNGYRTESKAELALALGSATAQRRIELSLPYAPDDVFTKAGSTYGSAASDAAAKAQLYGRVQNRLLLGNRSGMNLQCAPEVLPGAPFAPFVVKAGSTSALYRTNGTNWTFDAQGLVASTDALFWGGIGGNAGESWFPIAPGITSLPTAPATTTVNVTDASGNVVSTYQQMVVTGTVPVAQETAMLQATLRLQPVITSLPYALQQTAELAITTKVKAAVSSIKPINVPAAAITVAALAPTVSTGAAVQVPAAAVTVEALAPQVASGASVQVPAAGITVAGLAPELVGRPKTIVTGPAAEITVAGLAPVVSSGASVLVPVADVVLAGLVPQSIGGPVDPSFLSVQLLLHMDGANNSTTFTDSSSAARTVTPSGNAQISTAQSKFGGASGYFDGAGDYLTASVTGGLGSGDFTLEFWYYKTANSGMLFNSRTSGTSANGFDIRHDLQVSTDQVFLFTAATVSTNQWVHVAITRSGTTLRRFINGTLNGSTTASTNYSGTDFKIGGSPHGNTGYLTGYMDDVRVTVGVARYTASFTAPTAQFADR